MKKIAIKYGLLMWAGFTALFLIMHLLGLSQNANLRLVNGVVHIGFLYLAIKAYRQEHRESVRNYLSGIAVGMYSSAIGIIAFAAFMSVFFFINPGFLESVQGSFFLEKYLTPFTGTIVIVAEGIAVSLIMSYIVTRIVDSRMTPKVDSNSQHLHYKVEASTSA